jgi:outer membrane protein assembly factor BamB
VLAAPVAAGTRVYFTCTDGRVFCFDTKTGGGGWHIKVDATSAPVVVGDVLAVTTEEKTNRGAAVSIRRYSTADGEELDGKPLATTITGRPVLTSHQRAEWDYQGPKIAAAGTRLFNAPGQVINSVDIKTGATYWRASVTGGGLGNGANTLTPPALGQKNLYLGTAKGQVLAVSQADGALAFAYDLGQPLASQFVLADGNLYIGTANGLLVCLQVQNSDAEGWHAWGGDAQHNKVQ